MINFPDRKINEIRKTLVDYVEPVEPKLADFKNETWPQISEYLTLVHKVIKGLTILIIGLFLLYSLGIFIGIVAKDESQSKRYGANCLCFTTLCFLVISPILWICVSVGFGFGALTDHFVCETIRNPSQSEFRVKMNGFKLKEVGNKSFPGNKINYEIYTEQLPIFGAKIQI